MSMMATWHVNRSSRMGESDARVEMRFKTSSVLGPSLIIGRERVSEFYKRACGKNAFEHPYTVKCGKRLRVEVLLKRQACRGFRVSHSKVGP